jgi:hypothetical protein
MLHMDQQYSMTLGRPLGISGIGDCPPPEPLTTNPTILRLSEYVNAFTILVRQILSTDRLTLEKIDQFTDRLLDLRDTLPEVVQFDESWLEPSKPIPEWPLDAMAAVFYGKTHNYLILLNRQRPENEQPTATAARSGATTSAEMGGQQDTSSSATAALSGPLRGRERVLASARALLHAFEFFHVRVRPAMICWTSGQQAFNAAMILTLSLLNPVYTSAAAVHAARDDYYLVHRTYATFVEMHQKGIHRLAGVASSKLGALLMQLHPASSSSAPGAGSAATTPPPELKDSVMGNTGMMLLEDPGLQGFVADSFAPLGFQMAGSDLSSHGMPGVGGGAGLAMGIGSPGWAARAAPAVPAPFPAASVGLGAAFGAGAAPPPSMGSGAGGDRQFGGFGGGGPTPLAPWPQQQQQQQPAPSLASAMTPDITGYGGHPVPGIGPSFASPMSSLRPAYGPSGAATVPSIPSVAGAGAPFGGVGGFHTGGVMAAGGAAGIVPPAPAAAAAPPPSPPPPVAGPKPDMLRLTSFSSA